MVSKELKEIVLSKLNDLPVCIPNSAHTQWTIRCPYCGDSHDPSHGHLSIKIDVDDDSSAMVYRCFKCDVSGLVNDQFLQDVGVYIDSDMVKELRSLNRRSARKNLFTNDQIENFIVPVPDDCPENREKMEYINQRLGLQLTLEDCPRLKIVPSLLKFCAANKIWYQNLQMSEWSIHNIEFFYVGFLSQSNNVLTFRYIGKDSNARRYMKVLLNPRNHNPASFYMIPCAISMISEKPLNVHIAEGTFDIISIHENFGEDNDRNIYAAICGYGPAAILRYLIYNGLMYKANVHIYCDNDKTDMEEFQVLLKHPEVIPWIKKLYFHRNTFKDEKDYGVPKDRIQDEYFFAGEDGYLRIK